MPRPIRTRGELGLIERIRSSYTGAATRSLALGIGDDCAILRPARGSELLITTDFSLEGRHFRRDWHPARSVGHRALARGLSDLAAMGAFPIAAFLSLALPAEMLATAQGRRWVDGFFRGLRALGDSTRTPLAGGDTAESPGPHILADIVLVGSAPAGRALRRSTARAGDLLYLSGALGGAAAELASLEQAAIAGRVARVATGGGNHPQLFPQPRLAVGSTLLRRRLATACIDLSDGLSTDLTHLCGASHLAAELDADALPIHPFARRAAVAQHLAPAEAAALTLHQVLHGGEDYELLFTASPRTSMPTTIAGVPITRIGRLLPGAGVTLLQQIEGRPIRTPLQPGGWEHFQPGRTPGSKPGRKPGHKPGRTP